MHKHSQIINFCKLHYKSNRPEQDLARVVTHDRGFESYPEEALAFLLKITNEYVTDEKEFASLREKYGDFKACALIIEFAYIRDLAKPDPSILPLAKSYNDVIWAVAPR